MQNRFRIRRPFRAARNALALLSVILCGCGGGGGGGGGGTNEKSPESFRIIHAAADVGALDVSVGEDPLDLFLEYGEATSYFEIGEGAVPIRVRTENDVLPSIAADLTISAGSTATYIVTEASGALEGTQYPDNVEEPKPQLFKVRFINVGVTDDKVDFYVGHPDDDLDDADIAAAEVDYKAASAYVTLDPGAYEFRVTRNSSERVLVTSETIAAAEGEIITVVMLESPRGGRPYSLLILRDSQ